MVAENSQDPEQLHSIVRIILLKLLKFLNQWAHLNVKFNFNPEQISIFEDSIIENIELQPALLFEMNDETLD